MASIPSQVYDILPKQKHIYAESMFVFGAFDIFFIEDSQRLIKMAVYNLSIFEWKATQYRQIASVFPVSVSRLLKFIHTRD